MTLLDGVPALTSDDRRFLLRLARAAIEDELGGGTAAERLLDAVAPTPGTRAERGVFVTLREAGGITAIERARGALRGCIGTVVTSRPLVQTVPEMARAAAVRDPRFAPLNAAELATTRIEISALTPLRPLGSPEELVIGRDGLQLELGGRRAVFLPQVAAEQGWDAVELLRQLARKAGLDGEAWRSAALSVFGAEMFGEDAQPAGG